MVAGASDEAVFLDYACAQAHLGQRRLALQTIETGLTRQPQSVTLHANRGLYLHGVGRYDEELAELTGAVAMNPSSAEAQFHLGLGFARRRQYVASLSALQRAVLLSNGASRYLSWLGRIAAEAGRPDRAEAVLHLLQRRADEEHVPAELISSVAYYLAVSSPR